VINYINEGDVIPIPAPATVKSGDAVSVGKINGIAATDMTSGQTLQLLVEGHVDLAKTAGATYNVGDVVKVDPATHLASTAAGGTVVFGYCTKQALSADTVVRTKLVPSTA
jgi:predicted RecA/RadA family phage recombinase